MGCKNKDICLQTKLQTKEYLDFSSMDVIIIVLVVLAVMALLLSLLMRRRQKPVTVAPLPDGWRQILLKDVPFYVRLDATRQQEFEHRMMYFLATTRITGINTTVEETDKIYVAASAIIPIFGFPEWTYDNLNEVLLYPDSFNHDFEQTGEGRNILGMVGDGTMNRMMILSQHELRQAFWNKTGKSNTAIHEFVHLVDKTDGSVDGIPEFFTDKQYIVPWIQLIRKSAQQIAKNKSDIDPYALTNDGEFFAVVSEYFFERPELLKSKHPELYDLLGKIFRYQVTK